MVVAFVVVEFVIAAPCSVPVMVRSPVTVVVASEEAPLAESVVAATEVLLTEESAMRPRTISESLRSMPSSWSMRSAPPTASWLATICEALEELWAETA
ncbi:hypothetical protein A3I47_00085 [Candidatus Kaiserbacteria bacterium RIFCSPLOWO2_02_FULL_59_19]|nr:MAG: hypothetical protein A3I47_00085 [Candidatus Kaiserbacteria bacterium RIFCSPLOWO2_02_FULL_59_19]